MQVSLQFCKSLFIQILGILCDDNHFSVCQIKLKLFLKISCRFTCQMLLLHDSSTNVNRLIAFVGICFVNTAL